MLSACNVQLKEETKDNTTTTIESTTPAETTTETTQTTESTSEIESTTKTETTEQTQKTEPTKLETPETKETIEPVQVQTRSKLYQFFDTFAQKVDSYYFIYKKDEYSVKGDKFRIQLANPVTVKDVKFGDLKKSLFYYDTVYINRAEKTAYAYCEGHDSQVNKQCAQLEIYDLAYPVVYSEYNKPLPEDWLRTYLDQEPTQLVANKYYIGGRATTTAFLEGTPELELSFDPMTGLVIRADQKKGEQLISRYDYEKLAHNLVKEVDVNHRSKDEIPSTEAFYR